MLRKKYRRILTFTVIAAAAAAAAVYLYYASFYRTHFHPDMRINGVNVSGLTVDEAVSAVENEVAGYRFRIEEADGEETLTAEDVGLAYRNGGEIGDFFASLSPLMWPFDGRDYTLVLDATYSPKKLAASVARLECLQDGNYTPVSDAHLTRLDSGLYELTPEVEGNEVDPEKLMEAVTEAVTHADTAIDIVKETDCYRHPSVRSDDASLNRRLIQLNQYLKTDVTYPLGENGETLNADTIPALLQDDGENVTVSGQAVSDLVDKWVSEYYTYGTNFTFDSAAGYEVAISAAGDYGWAFDADELKQDVMNAITTGASGGRDVNFTHEGAGWSHHGMGGDFIEVSIIEQHVWVWNNGEVVAQCACVTGTKGVTPTVTGCYTIKNKFYQTTLGRMDVQGYEAHVDYFMGFKNGYGLHDASWRGSFGGNIYTYNGSHGCVNCPPSIMPAIYSNAWVGMPIIVYN